MGFPIVKILLVQPTSNPRILGNYFNLMTIPEPLALEALAPYARPHEVRIIDRRMGADLSTELRSYRPDVVGVTAHITEVYDAYRVMQEAKSYNPKIFTIVGGHHPTLVPQDFNKPFVDAIVLGEGEITFRALLQCYHQGRDWRKVDGIAYRENSQLVCTNPRRPIEDIDQIPFPDRTLTRRYEYYGSMFKPVAFVSTSRGCPYTCSFCSIWKFYNGRYMSASRVVSELEQIPQRNIVFVDEYFLPRSDRDEEIYDRLKNKKIRKTFGFQTRSDNIVNKADLVAKLSQVGLVMVYFGMEAFRQKDLEDFNKRATMTDNEEAVRILHQNNLFVGVTFIVDPDFDKQDFEELAEYAIRLEIDFPALTILTPWPGTPLYQKVRDQLTTHNYELYDILHAVLATRLPLKEFYEQIALTYRKIYKWYRPRMWKKAIIAAPSHVHLMHNAPKVMLDILRLRSGIFRGQTYLKDHRWMGVSPQFEN